MCWFFHEKNDFGSCDRGRYFHSFVIFSPISDLFSPPKKCQISTRFDAFSTQKLNKNYASGKTRPRPRRTRFAQKCVLHWRPYTFLVWFNRFRPGLIKTRKIAGSKSSIFWSFWPFGVFSSSKVIFQGGYSASNEFKFFLMFFLLLDSNDSSSLRHSPKLIPHGTHLIPTFFSNLFVRFCPFSLRFVSQIIPGYF